MRNSYFVPWAGLLLAGLSMFIGGLELASIFWPNSWDVAAFGAVVALSGLGVIAYAELRERPMRLLRKARRSLTFPTQWAVKFDKSVPRGGVIPVAVIRSDGVRFVIDIQGHKEVEWNDPLEGTSVLLGPRGKPFKNDPVAPLMQAAAAWDANAVLWLPDAHTPRNLRQEGTNLIVVMGPSRELKNALRGAEIVPIHQIGDDADMQPSKRRKVSDAGAMPSAPQLQA